MAEVCVPFMVCRVCVCVWGRYDALSIPCPVYIAREKRLLSSQARDPYADHPAWPTEALASLATQAKDATPTRSDVGP